jgi:hypothetical protein
MSMAQDSAAPQIPAPNAAPQPAPNQTSSAAIEPAAVAPRQVPEAMMEALAKYEALKKAQ